ncbi:MAG TPA: hypothetical protein VL527_08750 [Dongiaceae bacterium]|nr:hypothetical protein [Dongiaceae bacterium]
MKSDRLAKLMLTSAVYAAGLATFAFATNQILLFAGMPAATSHFVAIPVGAVAFALFIWANWEGRFEFFLKRRRTPFWPSDEFNMHPETDWKNVSTGDEYLPQGCQELVEAAPAANRARWGRAVNFNYILCTAVTLGWLLYRLGFNLDVDREFLGIPRDSKGGVGLGVVIIEGLVLCTAWSGSTIKGFNLSRLIAGVVGVQGIFQLMVMPFLRPHEFGQSLDWWLGCYVWASHLGLGVFGNCRWILSSMFRKRELR